MDETELLKHNLEIYEIPHYEVELIGYGANGAAFDIGMDRVAKITEDRIEFKNAQKIKNKNPEYLVKIYECGRAYWQGSGASNIWKHGQNRPLYIIVMEKLRLPNSNIKELIEVCFDELYPGRNELLLGEYKAQLVEPWIDDYFNSEHTQSLARQVFKNIANIIKEANLYGISADDLGSKNVGVRHDKLVYFDMGGF
jgi:hypothetical protein